MIGLNYLSYKLYFSYNIFSCKMLKITLLSYYKYFYCLLPVWFSFLAVLLCTQVLTFEKKNVQFQKRIARRRKAYFNKYQPLHNAPLSFIGCYSLNFSLMAFHTRKTVNASVWILSYFLLEKTLELSYSISRFRNSFAIYNYLCADFISILF